MKVSRVIGGVALILALAAGSAMADAINLNRPYTPLPSSVPSELTLQQILDNNVVGNTINALTDQSTAGLWYLNDAGSAHSYLASVTETGHPNGIFGIYSKTNPSLQLTLIDIAAGKKQRGFSIDSAGAITIGDNDPVAGFGQVFGFYWNDAVEPYFSYTEDSKNIGQGFGPAGDIKALTYQVANGTQFEGALGAFFTSAVGGNDWLMAFEDHPSSIGDGDFNDAVFFVKDLTAVPEPGTILLLGSGLLGLALYGRKRMKA